ncbi:MAG: M20/M25/M40 family metallo-hydrolase [Clostridia bacterium]|nr:M20/M25/M40 family metallo-hydrolase [Clostridia bacterium]
MADTRTNAYAERLSRMIQAETVSHKDSFDRAKFDRFHALLRELFPTLFAVCTVEDFDGSLLLRLCGTGTGAPILLMNHHDVVEAPGEWKYPPFSGEIAEGRVWGRGTLDTKGGLWAMMQACEELLHEGWRPACDVYFLTTCNEETSGAGADRISRELEARGIRFSFVLDEGGMILDEPIGGAKGKYAMVGVGEKGCADLKFIARSKGGHASTPPKNSPLVRLGKFMAAVEKSNIFDVRLSPTVQATLKSLSSSMSGAMKLFLGHPRLFAPLLSRVMPSVSSAAGAMLKTTVAFTMASGSDGTNVLPQEAWIVGNMRYSHHQGGKSSINAIARLAKKYDIETVVLNAGVDSPLSSHESPAFALVTRALNRVYPTVRVAPYVMNAASDSRFLSRVCDNCLRFAPFSISDEQLASVHGIDECVDLDTLAPAVDFYRFILSEGSHGKN